MSIFIPGAKSGGGGGSSAPSEEVLITPVEQISHGFDSSDIGSPVYFDGSIWILAIADAPETVHAAVIRSITDADNFVIQQGGRLEGISATIIDGGGTLTPGNFYRLSESSAGLITNELVPGGVINAPVYLALDTADALILPYRADLNNEEEQQIVDELNDLSDVSVPAPLDNQILAYETTNNRWIAKTPAAGGTGELGPVQDWGDVENTIGTVGGGTSIIDLDGGHVITATMSADHTFNFTSGNGHDLTSWEMVLTTGGFTPTFQFDTTAFTLPDGYDVSVGGMYWIIFRKLGTTYLLSERLMQ